MRMVTVLLVTIGLASCGGGGGGGRGPAGPATYTLQGATDLDIPAGTCVIVNASPEEIPASATVTYSLSDRYGDDAMEVAVVPSSDTCQFTGFVDDYITGSASDSGDVPAGTYDLDVICQNVVQDCVVDSVTWSATY